MDQIYSEQYSTSTNRVLSFYFDREQLIKVAKKNAKSFKSADPFPHIALDDLFPEWVIDELIKEFPDANASIDWYKTENESRLNKLGSNKEHELGPFTRSFLQYLNSSDFICFLEELTGLSGLLPDPHFFGGGLHQTKKDGLLKVHVDNNWDTKLLLYRAVNIILFLNKDWKPEYCGELEFWDKDMENCKSKVLPTGNRLAIFLNTEVSNHGHPEPLNCPENMTRKSLAMYFYTAERQARDITNLPHTTKYKPRPGETFKKRRIGLRVFERFIPPIFADIIKYRKRKKQITHDK